MPVSRRRIAWVFGILLFSLAIFIASAQLWLPATGTLLMKAGGPRKAEIAVVLAGDHRGKRILEAAQLVREGYVPRVMVSGPSGDYGVYECDLAIPFAMKKGYPEQYFTHAHNDCRSTRDEANSLTREMRKLGVKSYILVTSDFHTRRAGRLFREAAPDLKQYVVAAPDAEFDLRAWWQEREGQKAILSEWVKTLTAPFGI